MRKKSKAQDNIPESLIEAQEEANLNSKEAEEDPNLSVYRADREGIRKVLGDLEADIMEFTWENSAAFPNGFTVRDVYEAFRLERTIAYTTVMTTMARLAKKHLLHFRKVDSAYVYTPAMQKEEFIDSFVGRFLENLLVNFANPTEAHLERLASNDSSGRIGALKARVAGLRQKVEPGDPAGSLTGEK